MKYKHSDEFYKKQYVKYKSTITKSSLFHNYTEFKRNYQYAEAEGVKNITKNFVYETEYSISFDTYRAERDMMKKIGKKVKKRELLSMSTNEFAEKYDKEIMHVYNSYLKKGLTVAEATALISEYFFGSK